MLERDYAYLEDMLEAARLINQFVAGIDAQGFERDLMRQSAVIRQLEIIGEAAKCVSPDFKAANPQIPWRKMAGMRDILIHVYHGVDLKEVWIAATNSIPNLIRMIEPIFPKGER